MKKLHLFILKSYLGPLIMTFFITLFILVMQFLWKYIDDMVGKGLDTLVLAELLFYASVQVIPMALPLAILLASLMSFGNMGENYELTAIKASGISLPRIMLPLVILTVLISVSAFWFSNNIMPVANLKMYSLLYDVKMAKPELELKEQVFYDGIEDFSIKINAKNEENNLLYDIMIYDHRDKINKNTNVTMADSGRLQISEDKRYMVLTLFNGVRFDEKVGMDKKRLKDRDKQRFRTDHFDKEVVMVEMKGYDFSRTDEELFSHSDKMKNLRQLTLDIDSFQRMRDTTISKLQARTKKFYFKQTKSDKKKNLITSIDSLKAQSIDSLYSLMASNIKSMTLNGALRRAREDKNELAEQQRSYLNGYEHKLTRHRIEMHRKFTLSFACFIFFFIGAPLGAIIRKGGLGMPVVISIVFFIIYYIIDTTGMKMAREGVWPAYQGMWLSSAVLFPIGVFLTYKSATDSSILNSDAYLIFFKKLFKKQKYDLTNRLDKEKETDNKS